MEKPWKNMNNWIFTWKSELFILPEEKSKFVHMFRIWGFLCADALIKFFAILLSATNDGLRTHLYFLTVFCCLIILSFTFSAMLTLEWRKKLTQLGTFLFNFCK